MSRYWNERVRRLEPYVPGEQPKDKKYIKLNTNENPYPPSPKVIEAIRQAADERLRLYPDPNADELRTVCAEHFQLAPDQVFVGNGSDEVLAFSFLSFFTPERPVAFADITYSFYKVYANLCGLHPHIVPLDDTFQIPAAEFCEAGGGAVIPNPNAPTGRGLPLALIKKIVEADQDRVVLIDEAYCDFGGESAVPLIKDFPNLLVVRTLSKFSALAGIRVGFALGQKPLIDGLNRLKNSFNSYTIDRLAQVGAKAAIQDHDYYVEQARQIVETRERTVARLSEIGFYVVPSQANFIFISHRTVPAKTLFHALRAHGVLVRYFDQPRINNYLRVTIGTDEEMNRFIQVLKGMIEKNHVKD